MLTLEKVLNSRKETLKKNGAVNIFEKKNEKKNENKRFKNRDTRH